MAIIFNDGFDYYAEDDMVTYGKWDYIFGTYTAVGSTYARNGGRGLLINRSNPTYRAKKILNEPLGTFIFGVAVKLLEAPSATPSTTETMLQFHDGATKQLNCRINSDYTISVLNGADTVLGTSTKKIVLGDWFYFEIKASIHTSAGSVVIHVNETEWLNVSGVTTQISANAYIDTFSLAATYSNADHYFDDLYICDTSGTENNDFMGDIKILSLMPDGDGNYSQLTPSAGTNYQNINETDVDGDATYNYSGTVGNKDSYTLANVIDLTGRTVKAIAVNTIYRKDDSGPKSARPFIRTNSTDFTQQDRVLTDDYESQQDIIELNPDTAAAWTESDINSLEIGIEVITPV